MRRFTMFLPEEQLAAVNTRAEELGVSAAEIVRRALQFAGHDPITSRLDELEDKVDDLHALVTELHELEQLARIERIIREIGSRLGVHG